MEEWLSCWEISPAEWGSPGSAAGGSRSSLCVDVTWKSSLRGSFLPGAEPGLGWWWLCQPRCDSTGATRESLGTLLVLAGTAKLPMGFDQRQPCSYVPEQTIIEKGAPSEINDFWFFFLQFPTPEAVTGNCAFSCPQVKGIPDLE